MTWPPTHRERTPEEREERWPDGARVWSALMLARTPDVAGSILAGRPVMVRMLEQEPLRRALRGSAPPPSEFIVLTADDLDSLNECGPLAGSGGRT